MSTPFKKMAFKIPIIKKGDLPMAQMPKTTMDKPAQSWPGLRKERRPVKMQADFYSGKDFSERELELIVATLGVSATDGCCQGLGREMREATRKYLTNSDVATQRPQAAVVLKKLRALQKAMDAIDDEYIAGVLDAMIAAKHPKLSKVLKKAPDYIPRITEALEVGIKNLGPGKPGRPKFRGNLHYYIWDLMAIFEGATGRLVKLPASQGRGKFKGAFFNFCKTCLEIIEDPIANEDSDIALMTQFKVVFQKKRYLPALKDFRVYPTIPDDNQNKQ
jgi:hypothetical protein